MRDKLPKKDGLREFGLITGLLLCSVFGLMLPWLGGYGYPLWPWVVSTGLILCAILWPQILYYFYRPWMRLAEFLGWMNSRLVLVTVFYLLFFPVSVVMRALGYDPMARRLDRNADSYRVTSRPRDKEHLQRPF